MWVLRKKYVSKFCYSIITRPHIFSLLLLWLEPISNSSPIHTTKPKQPLHLGSPPFSSPINSLVSRPGSIARFHRRELIITLFADNAILPEMNYGGGDRACGAPYRRAHQLISAQVREPICSRFKRPIIRNASLKCAGVSGDKERIVMMCLLRWCSCLEMLFDRLIQA